MSYYPLDPFKDNSLQMLGYLSSGLLAGKLVESGLYPQSVKARFNAAPGRTVTQTKMKYSKKRAGKKVATVAAVKRMIGGVMERKQFCIAKSIAPPVADRALLHSYNLTAQIGQGTADGQRVGDSITLESLAINIQVVTNLKPAFYKYRFIIGWSGEEYNPAVLSKTGLGLSEVMVNGYNLATDAIINTKAFTPIYDNIVEINSLLDTFADGKTVRTVLNLPGKYNYQQSGSQFGKSKNLYFCVIPEFTQSTGTAPTDVGGIFFNAVLKFKDA